MDHEAETLLPGPERTPAGHDGQADDSGMKAAQKRPEASGEKVMTGKRGGHAWTRAWDRWKDSCS